MRYTSARLATIYGDDTDRPGVKVQTDGCGCCSHTEETTDVAIAVTMLESTIENLRKRVEGLEALKARIQALGSIPPEE